MRTRRTVGKAKAQGQDIAPLLAEGEALGGKLEGLEQDLAVGAGRIR